MQAAANSKTGLLRAQKPATEATGCVRRLGYIGDIVGSELVTLPCPECLKANTIRQ